MDKVEEQHPNERSEVELDSDVRPASATDTDKGASTTGDDPFSESNLAARLAEMPSSETREFGREIRGLMFHDETRALLKNEKLHQGMLAVLADKNVADKTRFKALVGLIHYHRRLLNKSAVQELLTKYKFKNKLYDLYYYSFAVSTRNADNARKAIHAAEQLIAEQELLSEREEEKYSVNNAYYNHMAELILDVAENDGGGTDHKEELGKAQAALEKSFAIEPKYAKTHLLLGRLHYLQGDFQKAKELIWESIDLENSSSPDYVLRVQNCNDLLLKVDRDIALYEIRESTASLRQLEEQLSDNYKKLEEQQRDHYVKFNEQVSNQKRELESTKTSYLQFLGFFTGIISFIVGTVQIRNTGSLVDSLALTVGLAGALLLAFSGFSVILHGAREKGRSIMVFLGGLILIASAVGMAFLPATRPNVPAQQAVQGGSAPAARPQPAAEQPADSSQR